MGRQDSTGTARRGNLSLVFKMVGAILLVFCSMEAANSELCARNPEGLFLSVFLAMVTPAKAGSLT